MAMGWSAVLAIINFGKSTLSTLYHIIGTVHAWPYKGEQCALTDKPYSTICTSLEFYQEILCTDTYKRTFNKSKAICNITQRFFSSNIYSAFFFFFFPLLSSL